MAVHYIQKDNPSQFYPPTLINQLSINRPPPTKAVMTWQLILIYGCIRLFIMSTGRVVAAKIADLAHGTNTHVF